MEHSLGWMGAHVRPLVERVDIPVEDSVRTPGGLVLHGLLAGGALEGAGAREGDVLVRVGEHWVPLKEDPALEVVELIERSVSSAEEQLELGLWRGGELVTVSVPIDRPALEVGLPVEVERFRKGAALALERLVEWQREDGSWEAAEGELFATALCALALRSAGSEAGDGSATGTALARASERIEALTADAESQDALGTSWAAIYLAETIGPLPADVLVAAGPRGGPSMAAMPVPGGAHGSGMTFSFTASSPDELPEGLDIEELLESAGEGGGFQMVTMDGSGQTTTSGELPEGFTLPEGLVPEGGAVDISAAGGAPDGGADLSALLAEHDPERIAALEGLGAVVERLVAMQGEDGGWGDADESADRAGEQPEDGAEEGAVDVDEARLMASAHALAALGCAQRVGLEVDAEPIQRGVQFLRTQVHDGKVASAVARGADRRVEAGRAATVAHALVALSCPETDPFVQTLLDYSDDMGRHLVDAYEGQVAFHLLATAMVRRVRGIVDWQRFFDEFRIPLVAWQDPDGTFSAPRLADDEARPIVDTAVGALLLTLQEEGVPVLLAGAENPFAPTIDGEGARSDAPPAAAPPGMPGLPEGAQIMTLDDPEQLQELLESMGAGDSIQIPADD